MTKKNALGARIMADLAAHGILRREAAAALGMDTASLYRRATGEIRWKLIELEKLAKLIGKKLNQTGWVN